MILAGQPAFPRRSVGVVLVLLLLLELVLGGAPAFAADPPTTPDPPSGKDDSKVSPLLNGLLQDSLEPPTAQQSGVSDDAVTRDVGGDASPPDPPRGLIRFDDAGNVQV